MTATTNVRSATASAPADAPSGSARGVWWLLGGCLAIATLGWGAYNVIGLIAHEEYTTVETFDAVEVTALDVSTDSGSVEVVAATGDDIVVTTHVSEGLHGTDASQEVVGGVLELRGGCPLLAQWCDVDYTVEIPTDRPVTINADNGSVLVRGIDAPVTVENDNGRIELDDLAGNLTAGNDNGRITATRLSSATVNVENDNGRIELSFSEPPTTVIADNNNGSIDVAVPDTDTAYAVDLSSDNGSTDNGVRTDSTSNRTIDLSTDNGSVTLRYAG